MEKGFYMSHLVLGYALAATGSFHPAGEELETAARLAGDGALASRPAAPSRSAAHRVETPDDTDPREKRVTR